MKTILLVTLVLMSLSVAGQEKSVETANQGWVALMNHTRFTDRSGVWVDIQYRRTDDFVQRHLVTILRGGYSYFVTDQVSLQAGYAYIGFTFPDAASRHEHRPWQQIQWIVPGKIRTTQWLRAEQRLRETATEDYRFNWRFRHNLSLTLPFTQPTNQTYPFAVVANELHIQAGKEISINYFDQNRLFVGLGYAFNKATNLQVGYLNVFQQLAAENQFVQAHAVRVVIANTLDFRTKSRG